MRYNVAWLEHLWQGLAVQLVAPLDLGNQKTEHFGKKEDWAISLRSATFTMPQASWFHNFSEQSHQLGAKCSDTGAWREGRGHFTFEPEQQGRAGAPVEAGMKAPESTQGLKL